jgi:hypothetical protein
MRIMKLAAALSLAAAPMATQAVIPVGPTSTTVANGVYTFYAEDGRTALDGSSVTFFNDQIVDWNLVDSGLSSVPAYLAGYVPYLPPLTPANSSIFDFTVYPDGSGPNAFSFEIASPLGSTATDGSVFWFGGQNNINRFDALFDGFGGGTPPQQNLAAGDPIGVWASPDPASTLGLLGGAFTVLAAGKSAFRSRKTRA